MQDCRGLLVPTEARIDARVSDQEAVSLRHALLDSTEGPLDPLLQSVRLNPLDDLLPLDASANIVVDFPPDAVRIVSLQAGKSGPIRG